MQESLIILYRAQLWFDCHLGTKKLNLEACHTITQFSLNCIFFICAQHNINRGWVIAQRRTQVWFWQGHATAKFESKPMQLPIFQKLVQIWKNFEGAPETYGTRLIFAVARAHCILATKFAHSFYFLLKYQKNKIHPDFST